MPFKGSNAERLIGMAMSDLLKKIDDRMRDRDKPTCIVKLLDYEAECIGCDKCHECIERWLNKPYNGGF